MAGAFMVAMLGPFTEDGKSNGVTEKTVTAPASEPDRPNEIGGPAGPEPTRYGDWERKGRAIDF